jgi:phenylacetate-CoA ligase
VCRPRTAAAGAGKNDFIHVSLRYGLFTGGLGLHDGAQLIDATVIPASSGNTSRQIQMITISLDVLCCTPSYACLS